MLPGWLALALGGALGSLCRYGFGQWAMRMHWQQVWPLGTLMANGLGCLALGIVLGLLETRFGSMAAAPVVLRLFIVTGFLGALTTFSTYELEAFLYFRDGLWLRALVYLAGSIVLGLFLLAAGFQAGRFVMERIV